MGERPDFREIQYAFARHIRDPESHPAPAGTEDRRMAIYRELFFNNLRNLISQTFPVLKKLYGQDNWDRVIRQFMARHEAQTPYFLEIPKEFVDFLQNEYEPGQDDFPFLVELAHYEWAELALSVSNESSDMTGIDPAGDLLAGIPVKSTLAWLFSYRYPVHRISADFVPAEPGDEPTCLAICRRSNDEVDFLELNPVTARLLERIAENDTLSGRELLMKLAAEIGYADTDGLLRHGLEAMRQMQDAEIILGVK